MSLTPLQNDLIKSMFYKFCLTDILSYLVIAFLLKANKINIFQTDNGRAILPYNLLHTIIN